MQQERRTWLGWLLAGLTLTVLIGALAFHRPFDTPVKAVAPAPPIEPAPPPPPLDPLPDQLQTYLVMGVDDTDGEFGRSDSMVVVSYDPKAQRVAMLSIPRDTWTLIPGYGYDKINHAYAYGGHTLAVDTVERLLGIKIDHWATLNFDGFIQVIDAVGGIDIDVEKHLYYEDPVDERMGAGGLVIDIQPGLQRMDGVTALKYSRFRADDEGDLGRMRRQQQVITALLKRSTNPAIVARLPQLISALYSAVGTDLSVGEMVKLASTSGEALRKPPVTGSIGGEARMLDGIFYLVTDLTVSRTTAYEVLVGRSPDAAFMETARAEQQLYLAAQEEAMARSGIVLEPGGSVGGPSGSGQTGGSDPKETGSGSSGGAEPKVETITVAIIDATGQGLYKEYLNELRAAGFRVARVSKSAKLVKSTLVIDHAQLPQAEERLRTIFPEMFYASAPDPNAEVALEIVLGTDLLQRKKP